MKKPYQRVQIKLTIMLAVIIGFFLIVMSHIFMSAITKEEKPKKEVVNQIDPVIGEESQYALDASRCVIRSIDFNKKIISFYNISKDINISLIYTGTSDIRDEYDQVIAASQLMTGQLVEVTYENGTLTSLSKSKEAWEYTNVTNVIPNLEEQWIKLYGSKYRYTSNLYVQDADGECGLLSISSQDQLVIRGYDRTIYAILVEKGHGTVILQNCEYFEGGILTIGNKEYVEFSEDMRFTVREGETLVEAVKDDIGNSTTIKVVKDEEVILDLGELAPEPPKTGEVTFEIRPFGAELFIDDALMSYSDPIEMTYGDHIIEVALNGYETYTGVYEVNQESDIIKIELPESINDEDKDKDEDTSDTKPSTKPESNSSQNQSDTGNNSNNGSSDYNSNSSNSNSGSSDSDNNSSSSNDKPEEKPEEESSNSSDIDSKHKITISAPSNVSVYINGVYKGITPLSIEKPLGVTYITLLREGYEQITHTVKIPDDNEDKSYKFPNLILVSEDEE